MGNNTSKGGSKNFRKPSKIKKQKIDQTSRWSGLGLCKNEYQEEMLQTWLNHFKEECQDLQDTYQWASQALYALKKFEGYPVSHYQREVTQCNLAISRGTSIQVSDIKSKKKKRDYDLLTPQQKYKKLYKKSDLIEEDMNGSFSLSSSMMGGMGANNYGGKKSSSINSFSINNNNHKASFSSINSNPSYVFPQYLIHKNDIQNNNKEQIDALELYVRKTDIIAKHLQDPNNILGHLIGVFHETFNNSFEGVAKRLFDLRKKSLSTPSDEEGQIISKAIQELQQFIRVMQETITLFYHLNKEIKRSSSDPKRNTVTNHFNRENMLNFVTSQIFRNQKLYEIMFMLLQLEDLEQEERLQSSMKKLLRKKPQDFYIQDRLCLNERTLQHFNKETTRYIQEEQENEFTGTESLNAMTEKDSNIGSDIKSKRRKDDKYRTNDQLLEENEEDDDEMELHYGNGQVDYEDEDEEVNKSKGEVDEEEEKFNDDCSEVACQFGGDSQYRKNSKQTKEISKLKKTKTQEYNKNGLSHQPTNCSTTSPTQLNSQTNRKSFCKEVEYYYTSSFDNQNDLLKDNNLNNSQPSYPYSSKEKSKSKRENSNILNGECIKEKEYEENQGTSESSSVLDDSKDSPSNTRQNSKADKISIIRENVSQDDPDKIYFEKLKKESYFRCLKYIMRIQKQQSPIGKMKMIVKASEHILTCINSFYKNYGIQQNNFLDADDVLSIFSYFSCKCYIYNMNTHIKLISKFITSNLLNSVSGYYLTTLSASLQNILEFQNGSLLQSVIEQ